MKSIKPVIVSIILTLGIFGGILYTSCTKDACKGVNCLNGCTCSGGTCGTKQGIGGLNCEIVYRNLYAYTYKGVTNMAGMRDTLTSIDSNCTNNTLVFTPGTDTVNYEAMTVAWNDSTSKLLVSMPITLVNNAASGSTFTVPSVNSDTFTYSGYGNVSAISASMYLTRTHPHGTSKVTISFNSFSRQ